MNLRQKLFLGVVITTNVLLWAIPSNVVELVARDRHTLLGRYSREHATWIIVALVMSAVGFYIDWAKPDKYKRHWFQVLATLFFLTPCVTLMDYLSRSEHAAHYVKDSLAYHRPPNQEFEIEFEDRPQARRSYPNAPAGYGSLRCVYHSDARGFRNQTTLETYDVVVLGDSFAEGSKVSDGQCWPARLSERIGTPVYNLGMSGYAPINYLASLKEYGLPLRPKIVFCMIYEGNDFRSAKSDRKASKPSRSKHFKAYFKQSPIVSGLERLLVATLGPIRAHADVPGLERLAWLPLSIPPGASANRYAFAPKQLLQLYESEEAFRQDKHWRNPAELLLNMRDLCREAGVEFVVVYAPTKARVMMPLSRNRLPIDDVHAFCSLRSDKLPDPNTFFDNLFAFLPSKETVVRQWCERNNVLFCSTTETLRQRASEGEQVYYTYDQHWTPDGHEIVAETVHRFSFFG